MKNTIKIINTILKSTKKNSHNNSKIEARNYILQRRLEKSPQTPIGFKSRSTSSYYMSISR